MGRRPLVGVERRGARSTPDTPPAYGPRPLHGFVEPEAERCWRAGRGGRCNLQPGRPVRAVGGDPRAWGLALRSRLHCLT